MNRSHLLMNSNTSSKKTQFGFLFLRALSRINQRTSFSGSSQRDLLRRYRKIKLAAYASMASVVGSRQAWSREVLRKYRLRAGFQSLKDRNFSRRMKKRRGLKQKPVTETGLVEKLRKLVPGGTGMDLQSLLHEATHYIESLKTQVHVMRSIADNLSS